MFGETLASIFLSSLVFVGENTPSLGSLIVMRFKASPLFVTAGNFFDDFGFLSFAFLAAGESGSILVGSFLTVSGSTAAVPD